MITIKFKFEISRDIYIYLVKKAEQEKTTIEDVLLDLIDKNGDYYNEHNMIKTQIDYYPFLDLCKL